MLNPTDGTKEAKAQAKREKKSERFEVRLPFSKKQGFVKACEDQGDTPSDAVRRFIDSYIRRADADDLKAMTRALPSLVKRNFLKLLIWVLGFITFMSLGMLLILLVWGGFQQVQADKVFSAYDKNGSGLLERGEINPSDDSLHRVMNVDGIDGISKEEFSVRGKLSWEFVNAESYTLNVVKDGTFIQKSETTHSYSPENVTQFRTHIVEYDLRDSQSPRISEWLKGDGTNVSAILFNNGSSVWVEGGTQPVHVMGRNRKVFLKSK